MVIYRYEVNKDGKIIRNKHNVIKEKIVQRKVGYNKISLEEGYETDKWLQGDIAKSQLDVYQNRHMYSFNPDIEYAKQKLIEYYQNQIKKKELEILELKRKIENEIDAEIYS